MPNGHLRCDLMTIMMHFTGIYDTFWHEFRCVLRIYDAIFQASFTAIMCSGSFGSLSMKFG